jgi:prepilin-type processing-associated H-X9-DG protein
LDTAQPGALFRVAAGANQTWGWAYQILPYMDQEPIWNGGNTFPSGTADTYFFGPDQPGVRRPALKFYTCPTRRSTRLLQNTINNTFVATIDYAGNGGPFSFWNADGTLRQQPNNNGPYVNDSRWHFGTIIKPFSGNGVAVARPLGYDDITDGQSYTILVAEKRWNNAYERQAQFSAQAPTDFLGFTCGYGLDTIRTACSASTAGGVFPPPFNTAIPRADDNQTAAIPPTVHPDGFGSAHTRGFNALFADGSVRFLSYGMATDQRTTPKYPVNPGVTLFQRLCDRNDSGPVDLHTTE